MNIKEIENLKLEGIDEQGNEKEYSLSDFKGEKFVLYFYPKDNTSGCTPVSYTHLTLPTKA